MPAFSSAYKHSKLTKVFLDTAGGASTDISDACDKCEGNRELELVDTTGFTRTSKTYLSGFADGKFSLSGSWNRNLHAHMVALFDAFEAGTIDSASFEYCPEGNDTGDTREMCEVVLINYKRDSSIKNQVRWDAEFQITGTVTNTVF